MTATNQPHDSLESAKPQETSPPAIPEGMVATQEGKNLQQRQGLVWTEVLPAESGTGSTEAEANSQDTFLPGGQKLSWKVRVTALAIAIATLPALGIGAIAYSLAGHSLSQKIEAQQQAGAADLQERWEDIQRQMLLAIAAGISVTAVLVGLLSACLARRAAAQLLLAAATVQKLGQGELDVRLPVRGQDEFAALNSNINRMAGQIQSLLQEQEKAALEQLSIQSEIVEREHQQVEEERQQKEAIQQELLQLLQEVEGVASGDLTVRAEITAGQIGIVADFFNAIIENLREIVTQVKQAAKQVNYAVGGNEGAMRQLTDEALQQATQIKQTLNSVQVMADSIEEVAANAAKAAEVARTAADTAATGGETMERTVSSILELRGCIAEAAKKVKRLGESSQQIAKVVALIDQIALQTNLLAINASIEAARAGEEGQGFAVVAEEVAQLAEQSAAATKEIAKVVESIQLETSEVVEAMERGTSQVVEGTHLVETARASLAQIVAVSRQIDQLVQSISQQTVSQAQTSQSVRELMGATAQLSEQISQSSGLVASSLQETVAIAQQLQASVETFKVEE